MGFDKDLYVDEMDRLNDFFSDYNNQVQNKLDNLGMINEQALLYVDNLSSPPTIKQLLEQYAEANNNEDID
jgi:DNA-binding transcriptional regulator YbjK